MLDDVTSIVSIVCIFLIAGSGVYVLSRLCGQLSFVSGAYMAIGATLCSYFSRSATSQIGFIEGKGYSFLFAFFIAVVLTSVASFIFGLATYRMRGAQNLISSIVVSALVFFMILRLHFLSGKNGFVNASDQISIGGNDFAKLKLSGHLFSSETGIMILILFFACSVIFYTRNLSRSPLARSMRSIRSGERYSELCAISSFRTVMSAHTISGIYFGIAGALLPYVIKSFEVSSINLWAGTFGLLLSVSILMAVFVPSNYQYWLSCFAISITYSISLVIANRARFIDSFGIESGARIESLELVGLAGAFIIIASLMLYSRAIKNKV